MVLEPVAVVEAQVPRVRGLEVRKRALSIEALGRGIGEIYAKLKKQAQHRRELAELNQLSDRLLRDIGLSRADLVAIELGGTTLEQLDADRRSRRSSKLRQASRVEPVTASLQASNQDYYDEARCA